MAQSGGPWRGKEAIQFRPLSFPNLAHAQRCPARPGNRVDFPLRSFPPSFHKRKGCAEPYDSTFTEGEQFYRAYAPFCSNHVS